MELLHFISTFVRRQKWIFLCISLLSFVWLVETLYWPFYLGKLVDFLNRHDLDRQSAWPFLKNMLWVGAAMWIFMDGSFRFRDYLQARAFPRLESHIRMEMFDHVQHHSPKYFNEHFSGSLANQIGDMVSASTVLLRYLLILLLPAMVNCIIALLLFSQMNGFLAWIVGSWLVVHTILWFFLSVRSAHYSFLHGESRSLLMGKIVDSFSNNFVVNLFYRFRFEKEQIGRFQAAEQKCNEKAHVYGVKTFAILCALLALEMFILIGFITYGWTQNRFSTGEVVQVFYTIWNLSLALLQIADHAPEFFQALGIAKQALKIIQDPKDVVDPPQAVDLAVPKGEIVFDQVSFGYADKKLFQNKNLRIEAGEKIGLVGYSGAGKSTFVNLILRFFSVQEGKILIDGQDIASVTLRSLREKIALIPQDPLLFHRSLEENIGYGDLQASQKEIHHAARLAHCDEFIQKTTSGYSTVVGERGTKLSGGERQRVAIGRAMLLKAPILILDEATSALDSVTESYIQQSLENLMAHRTTIVIAHRLSTLSKMDRILVFDQGHIIEQGTHTQLLNQNGHYHQMWQMQAGGFLPDRPTKQR